MLIHADTRRIVLQRYNAEIHGWQHTIGAVARTTVRCIVVIPF